MEAYIATILPVGFDFAPQGWLRCEGQIIAVNQYQTVFSLIGTNYGGNGVTSFNLPDLRGTIPLCFGQRQTSNVNYPIGDKGGKDAITLTQNQLPAHSHGATFAPTGTATINLSAQAGSQTATLKANAVAGTVQTPAAGSVLAGGGTGAVKVYGSAPSGQVALDSSSVTIAGTAPTAAQTIQTNAITGGSVTIAPTGGNAAIDARPPYLAINFVFCMQGIYPSRP